MNKAVSFLGLFLFSTCLMGQTASFTYKALQDLIVIPIQFSSHKLQPAIRLDIFGISVMAEKVIALILLLYIVTLALILLN